jgi:hypothetical protein
MSLSLVLDWESSALGAPQSFRDAIQAAANELDAVVLNNITVTIKVGYGDWNNGQESVTNGGALGGELSDFTVSYSALRSALASGITSTFGQSYMTSLPTTLSIDGRSSLSIASAVDKALGFGDTPAGDDGAVGFATDISSDRLVGVALHELTHAMGRVPGNGTFELARFTSAGVRDYDTANTSGPSYYSADGGNTDLADYGQTSDASDYLNSGVQGSSDPFNEFYGSGTQQSLTNVDKEQLTTLGFNVNISSPFDPQSLLAVALGSGATISHDFLSSEDPNAVPADRIYSVVTGPSYGTLLLNGAPTTKFTQADIDNGLVSYVQNGGPAPCDGFTFQLSDVAGNANSIEGFRIAILQTTNLVAVAAPLSVNIGGAAPISGGSLDIVALGQRPADITYTVITAPTHGMLIANGAVAGSFTQFTQADIDNGLVGYRENGDPATSDSFTFMITDHAGRRSSAETFDIAISGGLAVDAANAALKATTLQMITAMAAFDPKAATLALAAVQSGQQPDAPHLALPH